MNNAIDSCVPAPQQILLQSSIESKTVKASIAASFNQAAGRYDTKALVQQQIAKASIEVFKSICPNKLGTLVDLGCGTAYAMPQLSELAQRYVGLDLSKNMLNQARSNHVLFNEGKPPSNACFINADAEHLPLQGKSIDAYYSSMALQWCSSPKQLLAEIDRTLATNGVCSLAIMVAGSFQNLVDAWYQLDIAPRVNQFLSADAWLSIAKDFNWQFAGKQQTFTTHHSDLLCMLRSIKSVGANVKTSSPSKTATNTASFIGRQEIKAIEGILNNTASNTQGLALTYQVLFLTIKK